MRRDLLACPLVCLLAAASAAGTVEPPLPQLEAYTVRESWRQPIAPVRIATAPGRSAPQGSPHCW